MRINKQIVMAWVYIIMLAFANVTAFAEDRNIDDPEKLKYCEPLASGIVYYLKTNIYPLLYESGASDWINMITQDHIAALKHYHTRLSECSTMIYVYGKNDNLTKYNNYLEAETSLLTLIDIFSISKEKKLKTGIDAVPITITKQYYGRSVEALNEIAQ